MKLSAYRQPLKPYIMIIPMIDIIFFLLVFYIISTLYMSEQRSLSVQLPQAEHGSAQKMDYAVISISAKDELFINDEPVSLQQLAYRMGQYADVSQIRFTVNADKNAHHGTVTQVLDALQGAGATKVSLGTSAPAGQ